MERTIYVRIAYDGTDFHGWQTQPGWRTVQEVLQDKIQRVVRHPVDLAGSGRTDAGVHAAGQVASFVTTRDLPVERIKHAIGSRLPEDLAVLEVREVATGFNATSSATSKLYRYRLWNQLDRPVEFLLQRYVYHYWRKMDLGALQEAGARLVGTMDFSSMTGRGGERPCMVRTILACHVERIGPEVRIEFEGTGFLYRQVRNMVGTLLEVGRGRWTPDDVSAILESRDRRNAGPCVPPHGLSLRWVKYPPELMAPPTRNEPEHDGSNQTGPLPPTS